LFTADVPKVLEKEHCGDFTKVARRALRELAKPVESHGGRYEYEPNWLIRTLTPITRLTETDLAP